VEKRHKWCYTFSWVQKTGYGLAIYHEGCEAGKLFTWFEFGLGIANMGAYVPLTEWCFDSPRSDHGICDPSNTGLAASPLRADQQQADWRYCRKCHSLFFDGFPNKGVCPGDNLKFVVVGTPAALPREGRDLIVVSLVGPQLHIRIFDSDGKKIVDKPEHELVQGETLADLKQILTSSSDYSLFLGERKHRVVQGVALVIGDMPFPIAGHVRKGRNFIMPHDVSESAWAQKEWRYCQKCSTMFFDGYPDKGVCPAGGGHFAAGFNFVVPHDVTAPEQAQKDWRYCHKCHSLFFDGYADKGSCAAGGGHAAAGFNFVLSYI
jgi:hypothetical protein